MRNITEMVSALDMNDMFVVLVRNYRDLLGIDMVVQDGHSSEPVMYILKDPKKIAVAEHYFKNFILDPSYDIPIFWEQHFKQVLESASEEELQTLRRDIEINRENRNMLEYLSGEEFKANIVHSYLDNLYTAVLQCQRQFVTEKHQASVHVIFDLLSGHSTATMHQKLLALYEHVLKKKSSLDEEKMAAVLEQYFRPIVASMSLETLLNLSRQSAVLNDSFDYKIKSEYELGQFMRHLHGSIQAQIKTRIDILLRQSSISLSELSLIINHLDLLTEEEPNDLENYLDRFVSPEDRSIVENRSNAELHNLIRKDKLEDLFGEIDQIQITDTVPDLLEACMLRAYLTLLETQKISSKSMVKKTIEKLNVGINLGLIQLLQDYKRDVASTISDRYKTQKLKSIQSMLDCLDQADETIETKVTKIKDIFDLNPNIHATEALGRMLLRCLCELLNIPYQASNYNMTLFQGLASKNESEFDNEMYGSGYKKLQ